MNVGSSEQPCPLCGSGREVTVCSKVLGATTFRCVRCADCAFHFVNPVPDAESLSRYYDDAYSARHQETWHGGEDGLNRAVIERLQGLGVRSLVDLGAGQGRFVRAALDHGIAAIGVEAGAENCRAALSRYDVRLVEGDLETYVAGAGAGLECVTMLNVLEHVPRPLPVLERIATLLKPGGVLLVVVPNVAFTLTLGGMRRLLGFKDVYMLESQRFSQQGFDPPIHMCSFDAPHLRTAMEKAGLVPVSLTQAPVIISASLAMRTAKRAVQWAGRALEVGTGGRMIWGYSLLAVSRRAA